MPSVVNLPWQILAVGLPLAGNGKASTAPHLQPKQKSVVLFLCGGGVRGEADKNLKQTRLRPRSFSISNKRNHLAVSARKQTTTRSIHIQNTLFRFLVLLRAYCKTQ